MNGPEEYRDCDRRAKAEAATIAVYRTMWPHMRWASPRLLNLKRCTGKVRDEELKDSGWR